jgi:hypothetical protein
MLHMPHRAAPATKAKGGLVELLILVVVVREAEGRYSSNLLRALD